MKRRIPATMATQHPDNAHGPFWEKESLGFVSVHEEPDECVACFRDLDVQEFMWDWEGKYADESVIDKLFSKHYEYFRKNVLGKDTFLTFRLPNVWKERGYSLVRGLMVILTSEDFAMDLKFRARPLFEVILPMTEKAEQLIYIQKAFQKLAKFKSEVFNHHKSRNTESLELIPLVEGVNDQIKIRRLLDRYVVLHRKNFGSDPAYIRPFLARSDPALVSGFVANVLANKIALSDINDFSKNTGVPAYPIIGAGGLVFRGGLNPARFKQFAEEYAGVRTVTIQSAFRYDYKLAQARKAIQYFNKNLPKSKIRPVDPKDRGALLRVISIASGNYRDVVDKLVPSLDPFFRAVPKRRERRQHIGFLAYQRSTGKRSLPRAINFTAALYSLGIPPELIGLGKALSNLNSVEMAALKKYYLYFRTDVASAGAYLNRENLRKLSKASAAWKSIAEDIALIERILRVQLGPARKNEFLHENLSSQLYLQRDNPSKMAHLVTEMGKLRCSLG